ncbi:hypothetical protein [Alteraurantiacibacter aquimixticola]|uniref:Uncharacterized protein n=1 Tax=Alteraurantiacibacter aquimixticola TaxID=2489173 RepID=A0A4T3F4B5_9SPHN|nr:hypothetical protein [Alteraurantiacibacter aquimixticola]TIX51621.1 hypothetical protein E5222_03990 [Alteraurantiacibacter aquimixticola]
MSLGETEIARVDALLAAIDAEAEPVVLEQALRQLLPDLSCSHCDASDVLEDPFRETGSVALHLLDTAGHCFRVTEAPEEATGILIARKVPA